jgi:hypothetical protein
VPGWLRWGGQRYVTSTATGATTITPLDPAGQPTGGGWIDMGTVACAGQPGDTVTYSTAATITSGNIYINSTPVVTYEQVNAEIARLQQAHTAAAIAHDWDRQLARRREVEAERQRLHDEQVERAHAERERTARAAEVARTLLESRLDERQLASYRAGDGIPVRGSAGTDFLIGPGYVSNVAVLHPDTGREVNRVCAHPGGHLPEPDMHLGQMLALITDEPGFLRVANWDYGRQDYDPDGRLLFDDRHAERATQVRARRRRLADVLR